MKVKYLEGRRRFKTRLYVKRECVPMKEQSNLLCGTFKEAIRLQEVSLQVLVGDKLELLLTIKYMV